jgi:hypothetical protein
MSLNNIIFSNSSNNINQLNPNNSINVNNNLTIPNIIPQRGGQVLVPNPQASNNSVSFSNPILSNHINNLNQRFSNNSNLLYRYFSSNHSNIMNNQEENMIAESYEVSPMEIDNQVVYTKFNIENQEMKEKIENLIDLLNKQMTQENYELDFMLAHTKCYEICQHWKSEELYNEMEKLIKKIILDFLEEIKKMTDDEPQFLFMNNFIKNFNFFKNKLKKSCEAFSYLDKIYKKNLVANAQTEEIQNILKNDESYIYFRGMKLYYENLIYDKDIKEKILKVVIREFINLRNFDFKNSQVFQAFFEIITDKKYRSDFYENELMQLITNEIKRFYQQLSNKYITEELGINIININANNTEKNNNNINIVDKEKRYNILKSFLLKLYELINKEEVYFKNISEKNNLLNYIYEITIINNYDILYKFCIKKMFKLNDIDNFKKIYELIFDHEFTKKEEITSKFINSFNTMLTKILQKISKNFILKKNHGKIEYLNFYQYVEEIYKIKKKCSNFLLNAMENNTKIDHIIKANFEKIINEEKSDSFNINFGKLLHEEIKLCQKIKNNERLADFKDKFQCIFKFINNKDLFEENYRKFLMKRLLRNSSMMKENEFIFYEIMKEENGFNYVKKIEKMINDIFYSQNINFDFRKKYLIKSEPNFYIKILSQDSWPFDDYIKNEIKANNPIIINNNMNNSQNLLNSEEMKESKDNLLSLQKCKSTEINFSENKLNNISLTLNHTNSSNIIITPKKNIKYPLSLSSGMDLFEKYFQNQFSHRYLTYVPSLSWAEIYNIPGVFIKDDIKSHSFIVSFYQVCILMHFKKSNFSVKIKTLCEELNLSEKELETHYEYLIKKNLVIKKNDELILNELFLDQNEKINLNYRGLLNGEKKLEENAKEISHFVLEDRKYQIDAAIMHLLKNYKGEKMNFGKLKQLVCDYVKNFFVPEENIIRSRINNLLERNLIAKTVVNNETLYSYAK